MMIRHLALPVLVLLAAPVAGQETKAKLLDDFQRLRANIHGMVDAMPDEALRFAPTEGVRDFAEQIEHIAVGAVNIVTVGTDTDVVDLGMDPDLYLEDKAELHRLVDVAFDRVQSIIGALSPAEMTAPGSLFGQLERPRWMILQVAYEHSVWTLGATVPYLRLSGVAPPGYDLVPGTTGNQEP